MIVTVFQNLPADVLFEIFAYLSSVHTLQSFSSLNKYFSTVVMHQYLWHIHIGGNRMSLSMFNDLCENTLKLVGDRVVSLRITLSHIIGGWSLVSSSLKHHQTMLLQSLHLINIQPYEFDKLLRSRLLKKLHTLVVDVTDYSSFNNQVVEGAYLAKVCLCLPTLTICRLPFDFCWISRKQLPKYLAPPLMTLPNLSNTIYLRSLTVGMNTSHFLERLLPCIPFIRNLSIGVRDSEVIDDNKFDTIRLPCAVDAHLVRHLTCLRVNCVSNISFHRAIAFLSSVFGQLTRLSLTLTAYTSTSGPLVISGDTIQQACIDHLKPMATFNVNLSLHVKNDLEEKVILNSFVKAPFTRRQRPKVIIQERDNGNFGHNCHCFVVYTLPYTGTKLKTYFFSEQLQISSQMSINAADLFPRANELSISGFNSKFHLQDFGSWKSWISSFVPWSLLTKISLDHDVIIGAAELEALLQTAYNVDTLEIYDDDGILSRAILCNTNDLGTRVNRQIQAFHMNDKILTLHNAQEFCMLLSNRLPNLKKLSLPIYDSYDGSDWQPSCIVDGKNRSTKHIVNLVRFLVDHLPQLVSLHILFFCWTFSETPCFPHLIRRQLHKWPLSRSYRLRCSSQEIEIWL